MRSGGVVRSIILPFRGDDSGSNPDWSITFILYLFEVIHEKKFKTMEEKRPNALEMAKKENEEREEKEIN